MIGNLFRTVLTGGTALGLTSVVAPTVIGVSLADSKSADPVIRVYTRSILAAAGVQQVVEGLENVPARSCILVCNHQSHFDALMLQTHVPLHLRFVAKTELFKIPLFGQAIRAVGTIEVDRSGSERDRQAMSGAVRAVEAGVSVLFFPEGTRSEDGVLKPFKKGAATLAINAHAPIVPIAVAGTKEILPKGSRLIHGGKKAVLLIGKPISTEGKTLDEREALTEQVRQAVAALLAEAERKVAG